MPLQAVSKAEAGVTEAEKRLMQLQKDKEELGRQLQQTQKAVLAGKQKVEKLREEIQRRTEARTVSTASVRSCPMIAAQPLSFMLFTCMQVGCDTDLHLVKKN